MSGIYIPNMEMPTDEDEALVVVLYENGRVRKALDYNIIALSKETTTAQELPPHGRLVDARELMKEAIGLSFSCQKWVSETSIVGAPTVIPASEGE